MKKVNLKTIIVFVVSGLVLLFLPFKVFPCQVTVVVPPFKPAWELCAGWYQTNGLMQYPGASYSVGLIAIEAIALALVIAFLFNRFLSKK